MHRFVGLLLTVHSLSMLKGPDDVEYEFTLLACRRFLMSQITAVVVFKNRTAIVDVLLKQRRSFNFTLLVSRIPPRPPGHLSQGETVKTLHIAHLRRSLGLRWNRCQLSEFRPTPIRSWWHMLCRPLRQASALPTTVQYMIRRRFISSTRGKR